MREYILTWSIENISYAWHKTGYCITTKKFLAGPIQNSAWTLRLYPRGYENGDYFSLFLRREKDDAQENLAVNFELSCISANLSILKSCFVPENFKFFRRGEELGQGDFRFLCRRDVFGPKKDLYLPHDTLTLQCRMWKKEGLGKFGHYYGRTRLPIMKEVGKISFNEPEFPVHGIADIQLQKNRNRVTISIPFTFHGEFLDVMVYRDEKLPRFITINLSFMDKTHGRRICEREIVWFERPRTEMFRLFFPEKLKSKEKGNKFEFLTEVVYPTEEEFRGDIVRYDPERRIPQFLVNYVRSIPKSLRYQDIARDLWDSYKEKTFCDLELKTRDGSFFVHSVVLCARSEVFLAMLTHEMKEKMEKRVVITDISAKTVEKFLIFLYTDAFENLEWDTVTELYYAAEKYYVDGLKLLCSTYLMKNATCKRKIKIALKLAKLIGDKELEHVMEIEKKLFKNKDQAFEFSECKQCHEKKTHLAVNSTLSTCEGKENQILEKLLDKISKQPKFMDDFRRHYEKLINGEIASEIVIKTKNATYPAFKTVLSIRSSHFKDKIDNYLGYKIDSILVVGLEEEIVSEVLVFMDTDLLKDLQWDRAKKLYHASHVLKICRLTFVCSLHLLKNLIVSNACDLLLLAHEHRDDWLKSAVVDYIGTFEEILVSDDWAKLSESNLPLAYEILRSLYKKIGRNINAFSSMQ